MTEDRPSEYAVTLEDALARLDVYPDYDEHGPAVHTFIEAGFCLVGAYWPLSDVRAVIERHGVQRSGPSASELDHGLAVVRPSPHGPLFLATKPNPKGPPHA